MSAANFGNWPHAGERRGVHQKRRQIFRVAVLRVHVQEEVGQARAPAARPVRDKRKSARRRSSPRAAGPGCRRRSPTSQCGRGAKSNFGGVPQRRTSTLAEASRPTGTEAVRQIRHRQHEFLQTRVEFLARSSARLISSDTRFISASRSSALSPARLRRAISSLARLRSAFSARRR